MIDRWLRSLDNGQLVGAILVNFKKAFDLVGHRILLQKLKIYNMSDTFINWFSSYLLNRTQRVSLLIMSCQSIGTYIAGCRKGQYLVCSCF